MSRKSKQKDRSTGSAGAPERRVTEAVHVAGDEREPVAENRPVPVVLLALLIALLFWGDMYVMRNGGDVGGAAGAFPKKVYYPFNSYVQVRNANPKTGGLFDLGAEFYVSKGCVACHQPNGMGSAAQSVPPLAESEWVNAANPERAIRIVLNGLTGPIQVKGTPWNNTMVAWRDTLTDEQIAAILTYVRGTWGNKAPPVKTEDVKAVRDATQNRTTYWTAPELLQVPE